MSEHINHPEHYGGEENPYEVIKVMEEWDPVATYYFCAWNAIKYIPRAGKKPTTTVVIDMGKAAWYAQRAVDIYRRLSPELRGWMESRP